MAIKYSLTKIPDDLPPGKYATKLTHVSHEGFDTIIHLEFAGAFNKEDPSAFTIRKEKV